MHGFKVMRAKKPEKAKPQQPNRPVEVPCGSKNILTSDLEHIEAEYIRNLQQQVYFLELEANYLREQARKATEMHPQMTEEAERMLTKLREMQAEIDGMQLDLRRKESNLDTQVMENLHLTQKRIAEDENHRRDKQVLFDELVDLKKEKDLMEKALDEKHKEFQQLRDDLTNTETLLHEYQTATKVNEMQKEEALEEVQLMKEVVGEKNRELLRSETRRVEIEDKYFNSTAPIRDQNLVDLREEVGDLRRKLREGEMEVQRDKILRLRIEDDIGHLVKENAMLGQQVIELEKQLERERKLRESIDGKRAQNVTEVVTLRETEKNLQQELNIKAQALKSDQTRIEELVEELQSQKDANLVVERANKFIEAKLNDLKHRYGLLERADQQLRREKILHMDMIADLQRKLNEANQDNEDLRQKLAKLQARLKEHEHLKELESALHSQKWDEFSKLAESMKALSSSMSHSHPTTIQEESTTSNLSTIQKLEKR